MRYYLYLIIILLATPIQYFIGIHQTASWAYIPFSSLSLIFLFKLRPDSKIKIINLILTLIIGFLLYLNKSIFTPSWSLFLISWFPIFVVYPSVKMKENEYIKILSFYQIAIDIFVIIGILTFILPIFSEPFSNLPWSNDKNIFRNIGFLTEPSIASVFAVSGLFPNLILKRQFLSLKTNNIKKERYLSITRLLIYLIFIISTSSIAGFFILFTLFSIILFEKIPKIINSINNFIKNLNIKLKIKNIVILFIGIFFGSISALLFNTRRLVSFFNQDLLILLSLLTKSENLIDIPSFINNKEVIRYSSELRLVGPFVAFFEALKHPFGYDPSTVFDYKTFLPIRYFGMGLNSFELICTYTGLFGLLIFLFLVIKQIKSKSILFLYLIILCSDGAINKPYFGIYLMILSIISYIQIKNYTSNNHEEKI